MNYYNRLKPLIYLTFKPPAKAGGKKMPVVNNYTPALSSNSKNFVWITGFQPVI